MAAEEEGIGIIVRGIMPEEQKMTVQSLCVFASYKRVVCSVDASLIGVRRGVPGGLGRVQRGIIHCFCTYIYRGSYNRTCNL